jgi:hypothetical protein
MLGDNPWFKDRSNTHSNSLGLIPHVRRFNCPIMLFNNIILIFFINVVHHVQYVQQQVYLTANCEAYIFLL